MEGKMKYELLANVYFSYFEMNTKWEFRDTHNNC